MARIVFLLSLSLFCFVSHVQSYGVDGYDPLETLLKTQKSKRKTHSINEDMGNEFFHVFIGPQDGSKEADKIVSLPGQPSGENLDHYSGYVIVNSTAERALFYYFVESQNSSEKPLVLWLNGGPGCSSLGNGAMMELGPYRVNRDGKSLSKNNYAWNNVANMLFLETPANVGFSYSNDPRDHVTGDNQTAIDNYTFLVKWLERFPEYKTRDFFIAGESYAGHFIPQLSQLILRNNKITNQTVINLKGIAIGNAYVDHEARYRGKYDFLWSHALCSDEVYKGIVSNCNFTSGQTISYTCEHYMNKETSARGNYNLYDIYAPLCSETPSNSSSVSLFDPCSYNYILDYLNRREVQKALHAKPVSWQSCNIGLNKNWVDMPLTILPIIKELMGSGINVWMYSGDTDAVVPVTSTRYAIDKLKPLVKTAWYPWYNEGEVGGYVVGYENLTFVTIRGSGHFVPSYQPSRALAFFSSFLSGKLPPSSPINSKVKS